MQRWTDFENGKPEYIPSFPEEPYAEGEMPVTGTVADEWNTFYATKRGFHPNARGGFTTTSNMAFTNFRLLDFIAEISPRPILFVMGDRAHSKFFSENAYAAAAEPKELYVVEDAEHIDLYDRVDRIPFEELESFFKENLKKVRKSPCIQKRTLYRISRMPAAPKRISAQSWPATVKEIKKRWKI